MTETRTTVRLRRDQTVVLGSGAERTRTETRDIDTRSPIGAFFTSILDAVTVSVQYASGDSTVWTRIEDEPDVDEAAEYARARALGETFGAEVDPFEPDVDEADCPHGLSAWLCVGPEHYPFEY